MKSGQRDCYQQWADAGKLPEVLEFIKECSKKLITQKEMCEHLHMTEAAFTQMKKRHPDVQKAITDSMFDLKKDLAGALYKKAMGYETVEETQDIEDSGKGQKQKRKIHRVKKQVPPDIRALLYLITKNFGKEYHERYEEMQMMEKKMEQAKEEWNNNGNEDSSDENIGD